MKVLLLAIAVVLGFSAPAAAQPGVTHWACDAQVDNSPYMDSILESVTGWWRIEIPAGQCRFSRPIVLTHPTTICGQGMGQSVIIFTDRVSAGITSSPPDALHAKVKLCDLAIWTTVMNGPALSFGFPYTSTSMAQTITIENVTVGNMLNPSGFSDGLVCHECWNLKMDGFTFIGAHPTGWNDLRSRSGITLGGRTISPIVNAKIAYARTGLVANGDVEGLKFCGDIVGANIGIDAQADHPVPVLNTCPGTHINTTQIGILLINRPQTEILGTSFYQWGPNQTWYGLVFGAGSNQSGVSNSYFLARPESRPGAHGTVVQAYAHQVTATELKGVQLYSTVWVQPGSVEVITSNILGHANIVRVLR